jgi:hypothetical protein
MPDLVCKVYTDQLPIVEGYSTAALEASTYEGISIYGEDSIRIVPNT